MSGGPGGSVRGGSAWWLGRAGYVLGMVLGGRSGGARYRVRGGSAWGGAGLGYLLRGGAGRHGGLPREMPCPPSGDPLRPPRPTYISSPGRPSRPPPAAPPRRPRPWGDGARPRARLATVLAAVAGPRSPPGALGGWAGGSRDFFKKIFLSPTDRHFCAPRVAHFVWAKTPCTDHPHSKPLPPENFFGT